MPAPVQYTIKDLVAALGEPEGRALHQRLLQARASGLIQVNLDQVQQAGEMWRQFKPDVSLNKSFARLAYRYLKDSPQRIKSFESWLGALEAEASRLEEEDYPKPIARRRGRPRKAKA